MRGNDLVTKIEVGIKGEFESEIDCYHSRLNYRNSVEKQRTLLIQSSRSLKDKYF